MSIGDQASYQQSWLHLMGSHDELLHEARVTATNIEERSPDIEELLGEVEGERAAAEAAFREFMNHREQFAHAIDRLQRELAIAGLPLKGDII